MSYVNTTESIDFLYYFNFRFAKKNDQHVIACDGEILIIGRNLGFYVE